jgi:hypothetical protein
MSTYHPEQPGEFCFPPLVSLITSAARLMLALLEHCVAQRGGTYATEDTDSMAIVIERLDSYVQRTEAIAARVRQQVESANGSIRSEFQNIVNSAAVKALRDALENEVAALVLKLLVEYQVADIAGDPIKNE